MTVLTITDNAVLADFYRGTTYVFQYTVEVAGVAQDITGDTITIRLKTNKSDLDAAAVIEVAADVASSGASGIAIFTLTATNTDIAPGKYFVDIEWIAAGGSENILYDNVISCKERVSDV